MNVMGTQPMDEKVSHPPSDSISFIKFSPKSNHLLCGSWDTSVRCWEIHPNGASTPKFSYNHEAPVLCGDWSIDGARVFTGGCDGKARVYDCNTGQNSIIAQHDAPIKTLQYVESAGLVCTGSWDKTLRYWDGRQNKPVAVATLDDRIYCMDIKYPYCVVGTGGINPHVTIFNLQQNPTQHFKYLETPLKFQSRAVSVFLDRKGFALGSIAGRVAIHYISEADRQANFTFKCHRDSKDPKMNPVWAVNSIAFHPSCGTFATAGSDGSYAFWDKDQKSRLHRWPAHNANGPLPITSGDFNNLGSIYAYATSYDWSRGLEGAQDISRNDIFLHAVQESEIRSKK